MTRLPQIWETIQSRMPKGQWVSLDEIYQIIERNCKLDEEDFNPQSPKSNIPKWKRNVRNVLQYRKETKEIKWDEKTTKYLI